MSHLQEPKAPYERSTRGLRAMLFDALDRVQTGEMKPSEAGQLSGVVRQILATASFELQMQRHTASLPMPVALVEQHLTEPADGA